MSSGSVTMSESFPGAWGWGWGWPSIFETYVTEENFIFGHYLGSFESYSFHNYVYDLYYYYYYYSRSDAFTAFIATCQEQEDEALLAQAERVASMQPRLGL